MPGKIQTLAAHAQKQFSGILESCTVAVGEVTIKVPVSRLHEVCQALRDEPIFSFDMLIDICGIDYLEYGETGSEPRFAVVYHLLSIEKNQRIRVKTYLDETQPRVESVTDIWSAANWFEREAFDLFGFLFDGHPDLRRLLTDYGFIGHPFRKDFPLIGNVEMRYDLETRRVVYEPVSIDPRITVSRVIRHDHRYLDETSNDEVPGG